MSLSIVLLKGNQSPGCVRDCLAISREEVRAREATSGGSRLGLSPNRLGHFAITFAPVASLDVPIYQVQI